MRVQCSGFLRNTCLEPLMCLVNHATLSLYSELGLLLLDHIVLFFRAISECWTKRFLVMGIVP